MPRTTVQMSARTTVADGVSTVAIHLRNPSPHIAFFVRATVSASRNGNEILPIEYDDNYITIFPGDFAELHATLPRGTQPHWVRLEGYNTPAISIELK